MLNNQTWLTVPSSTLWRQKASDWLSCNEKKWKTDPVMSVQGPVPWTVSKDLLTHSQSFQSVSLWAAEWHFHHSSQRQPSHMPAQPCWSPTTHYSLQILQFPRAIMLEISIIQPIYAYCLHTGHSLGDRHVQYEAAFHQYQQYFFMPNTTLCFKAFNSFIFVICHKS